MTGDDERGKARTVIRADARIIWLCLILLVVGASLLLVSRFFTPGTEVVIGMTALFAFPTALGGLVGSFRSYEGRYASLGCFAWPTAVVLGLTGFAWLVLGEGWVCIAIILPLWIPFAIAGAIAARWNQRRADRLSSARVFTPGWLALPLASMVLDLVVPPTWSYHDVTRTVLIDAPPERVWPLLLSIPAIRRDEGRYTFAQDVLRIPRPASANLVRHGPDLIRHAEWIDDVRFDEIVTGIVPGRAIGWRFAFNDPGLRRRIDQHIDPAGATLQIERGGYVLTSAGSGRSALRLNTRYRMRASLEPYLMLWGELVLGGIESNVLGIIEDRAEMLPAGQTGTRR